MTVRDEAFNQGIVEFHAEAAGVLAISIVRRQDFAGLVAAALQGSAEGSRLALAVTKASRMICDAPTESLPLCISCPQRLHMRGIAAFAIALPARDDPSRLMAMAMCDACAGEPREIADKVLQAMRQIWPDLRQGSVHPVAGHA